MSQIIHSRAKDLGGFQVRRTLPVAHRRAVGPFVFFDHMGPMTLDENHALDVRPHPHIGLATVTYLFEGQGFHRDSLGSAQIIKPGDINWMTAGRGIVHSERTPEEDRKAQDHRRIHGVQIWIGLPKQDEECAPEFTHWPKELMPDAIVSPDLSAKVLLGEFMGKSSPVKTKSRTLFLDLFPQANVQEILAFNEKEIAFYLVDGRCEVNDEILEPGDMIVVDNPGQIAFRMDALSRVMVIGGEPFPEPRFMWWNFVSSRKERIREAAADWEAQRMGKVPEESEWIPLPKDPLP